MMSTAQRDRELIADLEAEGAGLRVTNVMGIAGRAPAHEARLQAHEVAMLLVAIAPRFTQREYAFVDRGDSPRPSCSKQHLEWSSQADLCRNSIRNKNIPDTD
jgi:hypothetical protein